MLWRSERAARIKENSGIFRGEYSLVLAEEAAQPSERLAFFYDCAAFRLLKPAAAARSLKIFHVSHVFRHELLRLGFVFRHAEPVHQA